MAAAGLCSDHSWAHKHPTSRILAFISPAQALLEFGRLLLIPTMAIFVISFIPLPNLRKWHVRGFLCSCLLATEIVTSAVFITSAGPTYIFIVVGE